MNTPVDNSLRPRASTAERWEYIILASSNRPPAPKSDLSAAEQAVRLLASTKSLVFLSAVLATVALAPQTPGAHNWAAERAAQSTAQSAAPTAAVTP